MYCLFLYYFYLPHVHTCTRLIYHQWNKRGTTSKNNFLTKPQEKFTYVKFHNIICNMIGQDIKIQWRLTRSVGRWKNIQNHCHLPLFVQISLLYIYAWNASQNDHITLLRVTNNTILWIPIISEGHRKEFKDLVELKRFLKAKSIGFHFLHENGIPFCT